VRTSIFAMKPRCIFCYHKSGTILLKNVFEELCNIYDWAFLVRMGRQQEIPSGVDFTLFGHSPVEIQLQTHDFHGVHVIRDPRDIIVSGYLYHLRTTEAWCIQNNFDLTPPIDYPNVPFSQRHRSEEWKKEYIHSLGGLSYQEKLKSLSTEDGIAFEMLHYGRWTIESMMKWDYSASNMLEVRFEEIMGEYDFTFRRMFRFLRLTEEQENVGMKIAQRHDISRKTEKEIYHLDHVFSRKTSRWRHHFSPAHKELFIELFGNCLVKLGYENTNGW